MRLYLHPHDRERLNVELALSADEAEEWIARLQTAVRNAREGQGDQLLLLGEPARIVVTVQERGAPSHEPLLPPYIDRDTVPEAQRMQAYGRAGVILLALLVILALLVLRFRILPL